MEIIFTDLIAESYLLYTKKNDNDIAHFYYQEQLKFKEGGKSDFVFSKKQFYNKLITQIQDLINEKKDVPKSNSEVFKGITEEEEQGLFEMDGLDFEEEKDFYSYEAPSFNVDNWEKCEDAYILKEAIRFKLVSLKDPVAFIDPSDCISKETLVLRKSKLEYLKSEAERASKVTSIDELDEIPAIETPIPSALGTNVSKSDNDIKIAVQNAFKFTLTNISGNKQILSQQDYDRLVIWVTAYFENGFEIPEINEPIKEMNTTKGNITHVFIDLFTELFPSRAKSKPQNYYELIKRCFYKLRDDKISNISKGKKSLDYDKIIKQTPKI